MTIEVFIYLFTIGSTISGLITQATKKAVPELSTNIVALINAFFVGLCGSILAMSLLDIPLSANNLICAVLMGVCIWVGSMCGYDKCKQTLEQLKR